MWRFIFYALIAYLIFTAFKRSNDKQKNGNNTSKKDTPTKDPSTKDQGTEDMVQCASCKVHLPRSEAFLVNGAFYCSKPHIPK